MKELVHIVSYLLCLSELSPLLCVCTLDEALDLLSDGKRARSGFRLLLLLPSCVLSKASAVYVCLRSYLPRCQTLLSGGHEVCCQSGALFSFTVSVSLSLCCCAVVLYLFLRRNALQLSQSARGAVACSSAVGRNCGCPPACTACGAAEEVPP